MKYTKIYSHWIFDDVQDGKKVYALDRKLKKIALLNDLTIEQVVAVINSDKEEPSRYEFWYEETEKVTEVTEETEETEND